MKRVYAVSLLIAAALVLALGTGFSVYFRIFFLTALVTAGSFSWAFLNLSGVKVTVLRTYGRLRVEESLETKITVHNSGFLPKFGLEINDLLELPGHNTGAVVNLPPFGDTPLMMYIVVEPIPGDFKPRKTMLVRYENDLPISGSHGHWVNIT